MGNSICKSPLADAYLARCRKGRGPVWLDGVRDGQTEEFNEAIRPGSERALSSTGRTFDFMLSDLEATKGC